MELSIKFSSDYITVTEQSVSTAKGIVVHNVVRAAMPEGAFANGIVVNTSAVADVLKSVLKENKIKTKKTVLCISGMDLIYKEVKLPKSAPRHLRDMLRNELLKTNALKNGYQFDYIPIGKDDKGMDIYGVYLIPSELAANYEQTMKRAGLILERVEPIRRSMEKLAALLELRELENRTILIDAEHNAQDVVMVGKDMKSIYRNIQITEEDIEENIFIVSAIKNISLADDPLERTLNSLAEAVSKLIQFQSQSSRESRVDKILLYGELANNEDFLQRLSVRAGIEVKVCRLPEVEVDSAVGYSTIGAVCGELVGESKQLSFVRLNDGADAITLKDQLPILIGLAITICFAIYYAVLSAGTSRLEQENRELQTKIASIEASEEYKEKEELSEKLKKLTAYNENCGVCIETLEGTNRFTAEDFKKADALLPQGITILGYEYSDGKIRFRCIADRQEGPSEFAEKLTNAGVYTSVTYTGFSAYQKNDGTAEYSFVLECSGEEKEDVSTEE